MKMAANEISEIQEESDTLAIQNLAKIQKGDNDNKVFTASRKAVVAKWVSSIILAMLFLTCLVFSKITIVALSEALSANNSLNLIDRSRIFVMLQIIGLVPHAINLARGIWCGLLRRDRKFPLQRKQWILATVLSLLESFGLCVFIFIIPGLCKPNQTILLMNYVFVFPLVGIGWTYIKTRQQDRQLQDWQGRQSQTQSNASAYFRGSLSFVLELSGIGITIYLLKNVPKSNLVIALAGVVAVSISWIPSLQKFLVENTKYVHPMNKVGPSTSVDVQDASCSREDNATLERPAWKLAAWMSFVKLLATMGFSMVIYFNDTLSPFHDKFGKADIQTYKEGLKDLRSGEAKELFYVGAHIIVGFTGYILGYIACKTRSQLLGFSIPLMAATPLSVILLTVFDTCKSFLLYPGVDGKYECTITNTGVLFLTLATSCFVAAQVLSTWRLLFTSKFIVMLREDQLFWTPMYNSALLEHWIMLTRRNEVTDKENLDLKPSVKAERTRIFICTTMYRETEEEMEQLLKSLQGINNHAAHYKGLQFESHIFFDGAVRNDIPTEFLVQLVVLVEEIIGTSAKRCTISKTPYGMSLSWRLVSQGKEGMPFTIHLKDNSKVKNKKRWSQVMYMSFVLDCQLKNSTKKTNYDVEAESYILTTDADVKFTPDNVEALLDLMSLDKTVGAVCARTHPLGSGPVVWYQKFEYAIGHWFQKAAEHVIGSVLCSPGCFSVYRCKAIRDVLPLYATNVEKAEEFLTKDMGEDRWFCTLLVQSGWRIEYCAASENKTHCPEDFDEFFKQRRRWIASTLANLWLLIKEWRYIRKYNLRVSFLFLIYQIILLVATLIGPSSIILVVSGGLTYGENWNPVATVILQLVLCVCFTVICLYTSQKVQLYAAKCLTCFYAVIMMIVIVGTAVEIATDIQGVAGSENNFISDKIKISTTSVYIFTMAGIFVTTGVLHLQEITCLFHGFIYILLLPSAYLILIIYSICNITDSSWGTREDVEQVISPTSKSWKRTFKKYIETIFFCCFGKYKHDDNCLPAETISVGTQVNQSNEVDMADDKDTSNGHAQQTEMAHNSCDNAHKTVEDWLGPDMAEEANTLRMHGFENTSFISGMMRSEIKELGMKNKGRINALLGMIEQLEDYEIPAGVPENAESWLKSLDLLEYKDNFKRNKIIAKRDMEILKDYKIKEIRNELGIKKIGHIKRLLKGIRRLRKATEAEEKRANIKQILVEHVEFWNTSDPSESAKTNKQQTLQTRFEDKEDNSDLYKFWERLREQCLIPRSAVFESDNHLRAKLAELRNRWLAGFAMINILWLILITTLADKGKLLGVFGSNPIGFLVIVLFGFVLIVQFFAMIIHRISTLMHFLGRTPYNAKSKLSSWVYGDSDMEALDKTELKQFAKFVEKANKRVVGTVDESTPPLGRH